MTTIAYSEKLGTISCDTLCIHQNVKFFTESKFYVCEHFLLASSGCAGEARRVANIIEKTIEKNSIYSGDIIYKINMVIDWKKEDFEGSHLFFTRRNTEYKNKGGAAIYAGHNFYPIGQKIKALGSGLEFATSFMALKPDAPTKEAVEFASQFDVYTGGEVKTFDLINWRYI